MSLAEVKKLLFPFRPVRVHTSLVNASPLKPEKLAGVDILVMRHGRSGAPYLAARHLNAAVVNGGDGWHAHPTQALLDLYTIRRHLGGVRGRKVAILSVAGCVLMIGTLVAVNFMPEGNR